MKVLVACPSFNRPYDIMKRTGRWIKNLETDWKIFVEPQQFRYYEQSFSADQLVKTGTGIGISGQLRYIRKYADEHGYDWVFKTDDDMFFKAEKTKAADSHKVVDRFIADSMQFLKSLEEMGDKAGGFTIAKPKNYRFRTGTWKLRNKTFLGNYLVRTQFIDLPEGLKLSDDMIIGVNVAMAGYDIYTYHDCYEDSMLWTNKGGCQSYDRFKMTHDDIAILKETYPLITFKMTGEMADIDVSPYFSKQMYENKNSKIIS